MGTQLQKKEHRAQAVLSRLNVFECRHCPDWRFDEICSGKPGQGAIEPERHIQLTLPPFKSLLERK